MLLSLAKTYLVLGNYYDSVGDSRRYSEFTELALDLSTKINHPTHQMQALRYKAIISRRRGEYHESIQYHREAQKLARLNGRVN